MTLPIKGSAQAPGPLGLSPGSTGGRVPGPIGTLWDQQSNPPGSGTVSKSVKRTTMPLPTKDQDNKDVHVILWPLFDSSRNAPSFTEVKQAPGIANCPVASMLAAMASNSAGQAIIQGMVTENSGNVLTDH
jgi:hypothetical protein